MNKKERGQGLTEMAVITPILIMMFIGLVEIGWFLWGYMTVLGIDREAARFATRPGVLGISQTGEITGYEKVITHTLAVADGTKQLKLKEYIRNQQLNLPGPKAQVIISVIGVSTKIPCSPANECYDHITLDLAGNEVLDPQCETMQDYPQDDLIISPALISSTLYLLPTNTNKTLIMDYSHHADEMKQANDKMNCLYGAASHYNWSDDVSVTVEIYYEQPQLLGFPLFLWLGDPLRIRTYSTFRLEDTAGLN
jgi:hypothetical protein